MIAQKLILSYGSQLVIQFIQIVASIIVARIAGPTVLGTVAFGVAFVSMFLFIADLGIGSAHVKLVSEGQDMGKCISTFSVLKAFNISLFFVIVLGIFLVQKYVLHIRFESRAHEYVIIIMLIVVTVNQFLYIPIRTFAARTEQAKQTIPEFTRIFVYQILRVIIVLLGYRAVALALGELIATLLIIPLVLYLFRDYPRDKFDKSLAARYVKISLPIIFIGMSTNIIQYLDKVILQYFTNSEQVGFYTAGYRIGGFVYMIANSIGLLFFPLFSKAASNGDLMYIKTTIEKFERFSFLFIMPPVIIISIYSDVIIKTMLGDQYLPSILVMMIINAAMFVMVLNMPYGNVITGMGFFKLAALMHLANLLLFIVLVSVLPNPNVFALGPHGVALTVLLSNLFLGILCRLFAKQKCSILDFRKCIKFVIFGVINFAGSYCLYNYLGRLYGGGMKVVFLFIYFVVTYLALISLGWIKKDDLKNIEEVANIRKMGRYITGEMKGR